MDDVDDSGPLAQETHARKLREEFEHPGGRAFHPRQITALRIGQIKIEPGAEDKFALVRLAEVGARRGGQDHRIEARLHRLRHKGRSEEHTSELQSLMRISYAVFC